MFICNERVEHKCQVCIQWWFLPYYQVTYEIAKYVIALLPKPEDEMTRLQGSLNLFFLFQHLFPLSRFPLTALGNLLGTLIFCNEDAFPVKFEFADTSLNIIQRSGDQL